MGLNDPQWGNRGPNQGPPDLEELWRDFNRRLSGMFGRRPVGDGGGNDGGGRPPQFSSRQLGGGVGLLAALLVVVWLGSGFYVVDAAQRGIVLLFGRYKETTEPGLRWRLPYPIETHEVINLSGVRTVEIGYRGSERNKVLKEALMLTDDENIINIQFAVQWLLKSPEEYLFTNRSPDESVVHAAETAVREIVGKSKMDFVLYEGREQIAASAARLMQDILDRYKTGILISKVTMQNAQPPEQVQAAFDDAVKAGQDRERQKNEGQAYANEVVPRAQGTAARLFEEAEAYRQRVIANAQGEAERFKLVMSEYSKAPEVTRSRMYIETLQQVLSGTSKVLVDAKGGSNLLYLPLDKLMESAGAAVAGSTAVSDAGVGQSARTVTAPDPGVTGSDQGRSRDALRSRDREAR